MRVRACMAVCAPVHATSSKPTTTRPKSLHARLPRRRPRDNNSEARRDDPRNFSHHYVLQHHARFSIPRVQEKRRFLAAMSALCVKMLFIPFSLGFIRAAAMRGKCSLSLAGCRFPADRPIVWTNERRKSRADKVHFYDDSRVDRPNHRPSWFGSSSPRLLNKELAFLALTTRRRSDPDSVPYHRRITWISPNLRRQTNVCSAPDRVPDMRTIHFEC